MSGVLKINHESVLNLRTVGVPELSDNSVFSPKSDGSLLANLTGTIFDATGLISTPLSLTVFPIKGGSVFEDVTAVLLQ